MTPKIHPNDQKFSFVSKEEELTIFLAYVVFESVATSVCKFFSRIISQHTYFSIFVGLFLMVHYHIFT